MNETEQLGITSLIGDTNAIVGTMESRTELPSSLLQNMHITSAQQIAHFLERPLILSTGVWTSAFAARSLLATINLYEDIISSNMYKNKIEGFQGIRADAVIKLQVNSNKFQAGRLLMLFIPQAQEYGVPDSARLRSLMSATQLPRVELDLACETEVTMVIPYTSPTSFYDIKNQFGHLGKVYIMVYSPIATGASTLSVGFTVWGSLEKVDLVVPSKWISEMGRPSKRSVADVESASRESRPLSSTLSAISSVAGSVATIPLLSNIAGTAAWVTNALSASAFAFGYSKPTSEQATMLIRNVGVRNSVNCDGTDPSIVMGLSSTNKVDILPGFAGTDDDEMAIASIVTRPAWYSTYEWDSTQAQGTAIVLVDISPNTFTEDVSYVLGTMQRNYIPLSYVANVFEYWRGSIIVHLKFVKTTFHSGRLVLHFNPGLDVMNIAESQYLLREIIDIRETSDYSFRIPYVSNKQFLTFEDKIGLFTVEILNELVHPDTVNSTIQIIMEVSGGPDMEFAIPQLYARYQPVMASTWYSQMNHIESVDKRIGGALIDSNNLDPVRYCIGEKVSSILQLLKRYSRSGITAITFNMVRMAPFAINYMNPDSSNNVQADAHTYFASCYAYSRGSMRVMIHGKNGDRLGPLEADYSVRGTGDYFSALTNDAYVGDPMSLEAYSNPDATAGACHVIQCPQYLQYHMKLNTVFRGGSQSSNTIDGFGDNRRLDFRVSRTGTITPITETMFILARAVGDDFQLGYFLGTPAISVYTAI